MSQYGLTTWHQGKDAEVDIVFVHGLRGNREKTWTKSGIIWPEELLSKDVEKSRIIGFGYDSGVVHSDNAEVTQRSMESDARSLCSLLSEMRSKDKTSDRPIITVAHSLGGLVCAQVVVSGDRSSSDDSISQISKNIKGMVFLGTPFRGSGLAKWGDVLQKLVSLIKKTDKNTLKTLTPDSASLKDLRTAFPDVIRKRNHTPQRIGVVFFHETLATAGVQIVDEESATYPGVGEILPIRANHLEICKFDSADDDGYKVVKAKIIELIHGKTIVQETSSMQHTTNVYGKVVNFANNGGILNLYGPQTNNL